MQVMHLLHPFLNPLYFVSLRPSPYQRFIDPIFGWQINKGKLASRTQDDNVL